MNKSTGNAFINQVLVYTLVMAVFTGSVGFGTVWLRHEISLAANRTKNLRTHLDEVQRHLDQLTAEIAAAQSLDSLLLLNSSMHLSLDMPRSEQIERVLGDVEQQLAARRNPDLFIAEIQPTGFQRGRTR
jgi:hypothetical protein